MSRFQRIRNRERRGTQWRGVQQLQPAAPNMPVPQQPTAPAQRSSQVMPASALPSVKSEQRKHPLLQYYPLELWKGLPAEDGGTAAARIRQREGKKTLVLLGTSPDTYGGTPWDEEGVAGIWALNDAHRIPGMREDKVTAWFQLHHRWRFSKAGGGRRGPKAADHFDWLKREHPFPIYMQRHYEDIPQSVKFPLRDVSEELMGGMVGRGIHYQRLYYTSTLAAMVALAMSKKAGFGDFDRIEMYGIELATFREYVEQRPCFEFWLGIALGRGIQLYLPAVCRILQGDLYGWNRPSIVDVRKEIEAGKAKGMVPDWEPSADAQDERNVGKWEDFVDGKVDEELIPRLYSEVALV